jgi:hypothetical protein
LPAFGPAFVYKPEQARIDYSGSKS